MRRATPHGPTGGAGGRPLAPPERIGIRPAPFPRRCAPPWRPRGRLTSGGLLLEARRSTKAPAVPLRRLAGSCRGGVSQWPPSPAGRQMRRGGSPGGALRDEEMSVPLATRRRHRPRTAPPWWWRPAPSSWIGARRSGHRRNGRGGRRCLLPSPRRRRAGAAAEGPGATMPITERGAPNIHRNHRATWAPSSMKAPPPPWRGWLIHSRMAGLSRAKAWEWRRRARERRPSSWPSTRRLISWCTGSKRRLWDWSWTPARSTAATMRSQSARVVAIGFCIMMCFPAPAAATASTAWASFVAQMVTACTSARARMRSREGSKGTPRAAPHTWPRSGCSSQAQTRRTRGS